MPDGNSGVNIFVAPLKPQENGLQKWLWGTVLFVVFFINLHEMVKDTNL